MSRFAQPRSSPHHPTKARCRSRGIMDCSTRIGSIPVLTPLCHIAVHVVKTPCVGLFFPYRPGGPFAGRRIPGHRRQIPRRLARRSRPARILPFGLRRQSEAPSRPLAYDFEKTLDILPANRFHRPVRPLEKGRIGPHHTSPLGLRHFAYAHPETPAQHNPVGGLVLSPSPFPRRTAPHVLPRRDPNKIELNTLA